MSDGVFIGSFRGAGGQIARHARWVPAGTVGVAAGVARGSSRPRPAHHPARARCHHVHGAGEPGTHRRAVAHHADRTVGGGHRPARGHAENGRRGPPCRRGHRPDLAERRRTGGEPRQAAQRVPREGRCAPVLPAGHGRAPGTVGVHPPPWRRDPARRASTDAGTGGLVHLPSHPSRPSVPPIGPRHHRGQTGGEAVEEGGGRRPEPSTTKTWRRPTSF